MYIIFAQYIIPFFECFDSLKLLQYLNLKVPGEDEFKESDMRKLRGCEGSTNNLSNCQKYTQTKLRNIMKYYYRK